MIGSLFLCQLDDGAIGIFYRRFASVASQQQRRTNREEERCRDCISQARLAQTYAAQVNFLEHIDDAED